MGNWRTLLTGAALLAMPLGACGGMDESDPDYAEMSALNMWLKKLKAEDPDTASLLAQECNEEVGFSLRKEGILAMGRCMRGKYDEGRRWVPDGNAEADS